MIAGLLAALVMLQAEAAPPAPAPPAPPPSTPEAAPAAESAPAPASPSAPAEAAPASPEAMAPVVAGTIEPPPFVLGVGFGGSRRLDPAGKDVPPVHGLQFSTSLGRRYLLVAERLSLGAAFHFAFQRFAKDVAISAPGRTTVEDIRTLTHYDLAVLQTASVALGRVHPYASVGGGITMGHFSTLEPELEPGEARTTRPLLRAALGVDVMVAEPEMRLGLELDYAHVFRAPRLQTPAGGRQVFGNRLGLTLWGRHAF